MSTPGVFSTPGGYHEYTGGIPRCMWGYHEYTRGCSVHWRDTMSTPRGYHEYTGGCSVHWGLDLII